MSDIRLDLISPDPGQPRQSFDKASIKELAQSMEAKGLIVPIMVRPDGDRYVIVHGERRYRATLLLGWETIPAEVRDVSPEEARWLSLIENVQRQDLLPIEEARAYKERLVEGITQEELGRRVGKSQSYIAQKLRLLALSGDIQAAVGKGITEGHARQLLRLKDPIKQGELCQQAIAESWTVRRINFEVNETLRREAMASLPTTAAEFVIWLFETNGGIPGHDPYPEDRFPDEYDPPIEVKMLPLSKILITDEVVNLRSKRDPAYAEWLAEIFITLPPVAVFPYGTQYILADGVYRIMAAKLLGLKEIRCRVYEGKKKFSRRTQEREAALYGVVTNCGQNSLQLTKRDLEMGAKRLRELNYVT